MSERVVSVSKFFPLILLISFQSIQARTRVVLRAVSLTDAAAPHYLQCPPNGEGPNSYVRVSGATAELKRGEPGFGSESPFTVALRQTNNREQGPLETRYYGFLSSPKRHFELLYFPTINYGHVLVYDDYNGFPTRGIRELIRCYPWGGAVPTDTGWKELVP